MNRNYSKELDKLIEGGALSGKRLLLHSCCAPCSSHVLCFLREHMQITVFYYNPNITPEEEYLFRKSEQKRLIDEFNAEGTGSRIEIMDADYDPDTYLDSVRGFETCQEGGERCKICFELRLKKTAEAARKGGFDYFTTTLTISPLKNASLLNEIGERLAAEYSVDFLPSDFKKKDGYKHSVELSGRYGLYRQDYCGCVFSKAERERAGRHNDEKDS